MSYEPINAQPPDYGATKAQQAYPSTCPPQSYPAAVAPSYDYPGQYPQSYQAAAAAPSSYGGANVTYVVAPAPTVNVQVVQSYAGQIALACFVTWCCNPIFGIIAFCLAVMADGRQSTSHEEANRLGKASMWVAVSGIIVTVVVVAIVLGVVFGVYNGGCPYRINGLCYWYRKYCIYPACICSYPQVRLGNYCYWN